MLPAKVGCRGLTAPKGLDSESFLLLAELGKSLITLGHKEKEERAEAYASLQYSKLAA